MKWPSPVLSWKSASSGKALKGSGMRASARLRKESRTSASDGEEIAVEVQVSSGEWG
ncbi:hypothetical protein HNR46_003304 [Haloferula luteola]|uniref:Uncharacterized protein n=1 Tax=Haloferula luteola TaxID=595692 RepID=A0A840VK49_9BACT|nr:hypothetical protein [Haloferula luteola]MBB5353051.1 hypothetical protein [Haloferula luteola]